VKAQTEFITDSYRKARLIKVRTVTLFSVPAAQPAVKVKPPAAVAAFVQSEYHGSGFRSVLEAALAGFVFEMYEKLLA